MIYFNLYFLKKDTHTYDSRSYDQAELLNYFKRNKRFTVEELSSTEIIARYEIKPLNFTAEYLISNKSSIPNLNKLNPSFLAVNLSLKLRANYSDYCASVIFDTALEIAKMFNFYLYNELFKEVAEPQKQLLMHSYRLTKEGFKATYSDSFINTYRLNSDKLKEVSEYILLKPQFQESLSKTKVKYLDLAFYAHPAKRQAFTGIEFYPNEPFLFPDFVDFIKINAKTPIFVQTSEFIDKFNGYLTRVKSDFKGIYYVEPRYIKKISRRMLKTKFLAMRYTVEKIDFKQVIDI